jgi:hypothetical protein
VESHQTLGIASEDGLALRCKMEVLEWFEEAYEWATSEEYTLTPADSIDGGGAGLAAPTNLAFTSGSSAALDTGGGVLVPRLLVKVTPSASTAAETHEFEYRINGSGDNYELAGSAPESQVDGSGKVFFYISNVTAGESYDVRVRATSADFGYSDYVEQLNTGVSPPDAAVSTPTNLVATAGGIQQIPVTVDAPNEVAFRGIEIYFGTTASFGAAAKFGDTLFGSPAASFATTITGLADNTTYYVFAVAVDAFGQPSADVSTSALTDPG